MKIHLVFALSFSTAVCAAGYQGCLERVWLFQAYEIDELNPVTDRQIGFRCRRWDDATHTCRNNDYEACRGTRPNNRCTFDELCFFLGKAPQRRGWSAIDPVTNRLDVRQSAINCYNLHNGGRIYNFPPFKAMKGNVYEYNDYILRLSNKVNEAYWTKKTNTNRYLWDDWDSTLSRIVEARAGDHGEYLIAAARGNLGGGIQIHIQNMGNNPTTGARWETVDWAATVQNAQPVDPQANVPSYVRAFLDNFYHGPDGDDDDGNDAAREHHQVNRSYKRVTDRTVSCRKH
ncbi:hypothetical protein BDV96DRAFT_352002 [Lophiotrema nucula]|uniref:Uncharacterized protein n=1 Tax=Lophiotrema nucula TaxID=690887 RepID=A0A6A5ZLK8_9PLEO|nr:hypothetical protein BDV96DRAFT_352002 [Lophiotrema nucula]